MSEIGAGKTGLMNIGEEAKPPFAILPDPSSLFETRSKRFAALAPGHQLEAYLAFLAQITRVQHEIQASLPPAPLPSADAMAQALAHGMPPLAFPVLTNDVAIASIRAFLDAVAKLTLPAQTAAAVEALRHGGDAAIEGAVAALLGSGTAPDNPALTTLVAAGLQVHAARLAAQLDAEALKPIADAACPACGSPPVASSVVGWPKAHNARFCTCSLCNTHWNVVRVKCVMCSETGGISYHTVEGQPDDTKAETCSSCSTYVKIHYQVNNHLLEPFADDVATLGLDLLMREEGVARGGRNLFLLGY